MNKESKGKKYIIDSRTYRFASITFGELYREKWRLRNPCCKEEDFRTELADKMNVSADTVKKWRQGKSTPNDINLVKAIADFWEIDIEKLLIEERGSKERYMSTNEVDMAKHLYELMAEYIELFEKEEGFKDFVKKETIESMDGEQYVCGVSFDCSEEERRVHSAIRKELGLARFTLPEEIVNQVNSLLYSIEPDPFECEHFYDFMYSDKEYTQFIDTPGAEFYYISKRVREYYRELNSIFDGFFV